MPSARRSSVRLSGRHLCTVSSRQCLADAVCVIPSCRRCLPDAAMPDAVCQTPHLADAVSGRRGIWQTASGRRRLADSVWQTASGRRRLPDTVLQTLSARRRVCQMPRLPDSLAEASGRQSGRGTSGRRRLADGVCQAALCQTVWQTPCLADTVSSRQCLADSLAEDRLADAICQTLCLPEAVCQTAISQMPSARWSSARLSGRRLCQTVWLTWRLADAASGRQCLQDGIRQTARLSARRRLRDGVCQTPCLADAAEDRLADGIWQTASARWPYRCLPDSLA